jgi:diguanylate cyclase (GGDEF)-like protein/PAS domain S-box-containing protein
MGKAAPIEPVPFSSRDELERVCMRNLLTSSEERVFFKGLDSRFLVVSNGFATALGGGLSAAELIGKTDFDLFSDIHAAEAFADEQYVIMTGEPIVGKIELETFEDRPDVWVSTTKVPLRDDHGQIFGTFGTSRDVTAQIEAQHAVAYQALHDHVTGLANRVALMDRLAEALVALERRPGRVALLFIDVDDFKSVNDTLGHDAGDRVLAEVGRRLSVIARRTDTVARFGGDEFVMLCTELRGGDDLRSIGDRIMRTLREPLKDGYEVDVTGSVGGVFTSDPMVDPGELLRRADSAMYAAKRAGRDRFEIYEAHALSLVASSRGLAAELRCAPEQHQLYVLYQPVLRLDDHALTGVEALVRWRHSERGVILPDEFIPVAEQHGLIGAIDSYVLDEACRQLAEWTAADSAWEDRMMAVNVSGQQLRDPELVARVAASLERHQIAPSRLCLEITETALIGELNDASRVIDSLTALGVQVALDDFGTGYSTLAHLQQLRANILKIDRSFVAQIGRRPRDREIVAAVTAMAHALGMTVVGEGIETSAELDELAAVNCDQGQGYLFAAPQTPVAIARMFATARH